MAKTPAKKISTRLYFTTVVVPEDDLAVLGGHLFIEDGEPTITRPMICKSGSWSHLKDFDQVVYATARKPGPSARDTFCMLGRQGHYSEIVSGSPAADTMLDITDAGYLMDLRYIGKHLYACGGQNIVYLQDGKRWQRIDEGVFAPIGERLDRSFESIDGFDEDDIYAVGMEGSIWHWNGMVWTQLDSPTNLPLYCVHCASGGDVYVGGSNGLLFKGHRGTAWSDLSDSNVTSEVLEDLSEFQGRIYIAATDSVLVTDGGAIRELSIPLAGDKPCIAMDANANELWCVGDESVIQFDGTTWRRHVCPDNV